LKKDRYDLRNSVQEKSKEQRAEQKLKGGREALPEQPNPERWRREEIAKDRKHKLAEKKENSPWGVEESVEIK